MTEKKDEFLHHVLDELLSGGEVLEALRERFCLGVLCLHKTRLFEDEHGLLWEFKAYRKTDFDEREEKEFYLVYLDVSSLGVRVQNTGDHSSVGTLKVWEWETFELERTRRELCEFVKTCEWLYEGPCV